MRLSRAKLEGLANQELAAAVKDFADAEKVKIETELQRRSLESKVRKDEAEATRAEAEARLAIVKVAEAEFELLQRLKAQGVVLFRDSDGNLTVLQATRNWNLLQLAERGANPVENDDGS